jgi:hypothetical protein
MQQKVTVMRAGAYRLRIGSPLGASVRREADAPPSLPAAVEHHPPPAPVHPVGLVDRARERAQIAALLEAHRVVRVAGPPGIGTTTVLRLIAAGSAPEALTDGPLYLDEPGGSAGDFVTALYQLRFGGEAAVKRLDDELRRALEPLRALVVLDETALSREQLAAFAAFVPNSRVLLAERGDSAAADSARFVLPPLADSDAVTLFEDTIRRPIAGPARAAATALCRRAGGVPALIRWVAAYAGERRQPLAELVTAAGEPGWLQQVAHTACATFTGEERNVVAVLAATGAAIPGDLLAAMSGAGAIDDAVATLQRREITVLDGDCHRLVAGIAPLLPRELTVLPDLDRAVAALHDSVAGTTVPALPGQAAALILTVLDAAFEASRWDAVVRLGCAASNAFALAGRWDAWRSALDHVRTAAATANDERHAAWALHELGARAIVLGQRDARPLLEEALALRTKLGDAQATAATSALLAHVRGADGSIPPEPYEPPAETFWMKLLRLFGWKPR